MADERKLNGSPSLNKEYYYYYYSEKSCDGLLGYTNWQHLEHGSQSQNVWGKCLEDRIKSTVAFFLDVQISHVLI